MSLDGSNDPSSPSSTTLNVRDATVPPLLRDRLLPHQTKLREVLHESNSTDVPTLAVRPLRDSLATPKCGRCLKPGEDVLESSPTASACYVAPPVPESDGFGTAKITYGPRYTVSINEGGSMLTLAKRCGIIQGFIQKVSTFLSPCGGSGANVCL